MRYYFLIFWLSTSLYVASQELQPTELEALIKVNVTDFKDKPKKNEPITFESVKTKKKYSTVSDENGKFVLLLPKDDNYKILYNNYTDNVEYDELKVDKTKSLFIMDVQIKIDPPKTFILENVLFDTGKSTLKPSSFKTLNDLAELLKIKKTMIIEIGGHTDNIGAPERNLKLSQERAEAVKNYLIKKGIKQDRIIAKGFGDTQPISDNNTEDGKKQNRRTEVNIIKE